jgi:hypothetical protein
MEQRGQEGRARVPHQRDHSERARVKEGEHVIRAFQMSKPATDRIVVEDFGPTPDLLHGRDARTGRMGDVTSHANRLISYHSGISQAMTNERTALESALIPVTAYILVAAAECWYRHPDIIRAIDDAMPAEQIGPHGHRPGIQITPVYLWSLANIFLIGRKVLTGLGLADDDADAVHTVLDFWRRAAGAYRGDGHLQAWDAGFVVRPYGGEILAELTAGIHPVTGTAERSKITRFTATVMTYLFLLYFDTRVGTADSGPYRLPGGRTLLVRDFYRMSRSDFWWSEVSIDVPYHHLTAALVLDGVDVKVNDWGTSVTDPEDYLDRLVGFGLWTTDTPDGSLKPVPLAELDHILVEVRKAQSQHYRNVAAMTRDEKIACGAYVYFTFPKPFAEVAGVSADWRVPMQTKANGLYDVLAAVDQAPAPDSDEAVYYMPIGRTPSS